MPIRPLLLTIACVALAAPAGAGTTWIGAQLHFPMPARDIGDTPLGVDAGGTFTWMVNRYVGVGADLVYHDWPASAGYVGAFDRYLRTTRLEALDGSAWAFTALQFTGHVKLVAPVSRLCAPWVQVGAGEYRLNLNLDERWPADTYAWVVGKAPENVSVVAGWYGAVGLDFRLASPVVLGVDATYHFVRPQNKDWHGANALPSFSAFTVGTHVLFGWR